MKSFLIALVLAGVSLSFVGAQERIRDVIYTKHDGVALTMDIYKPEKPNGAGIIKIISGGWKSNHLFIGDGGWPAAGYTTFVIVHGTQPRFHVDEIVMDLNRAVRFVRANAAKYGVDPQKLGVTGSSAGGHLSLMLATRGGPGDPQAHDPVDRESSAVNAVACFHPPTDFLNYRSMGDNAAGFGRLVDYAPAFGPKSATAEGREELGRELSPVLWVNKDQPPVFIAHGDADDLVPLFQAERFYKRCGEVGAKCELWIRNGVGHGGWQEMKEDNVRMREWFDLQLLAKEPTEPFNYGISNHPGSVVKKP